MGHKLFVAVVIKKEKVSKVFLFEVCMMAWPVYLLVRVNNFL